LLNGVYHFLSVWSIRNKFKILFIVGKGLLQVARIGINKASFVVGIGIVRV
jgi:hypothetical protein